MKRKILKVLVPVLVLAMLLQVPFAFSASASDLSEASAYVFVVSKAAAGSAGNLEVGLYLTTDNTELIDGFGAALALDGSVYDFVNKDGVIITDDYKTNSKQVGASFALAATAVDEGEKFIRLDEFSMISYNADTDTFYLFVSGCSYDGLTVDGKCQIADFYLKLKEGQKFSETNIRKMEVSEWRETGGCPSPAIYPGAVSSKDVIFEPVPENFVTDITVTLPSLNGAVDGSAGISAVDNARAPITVRLFNGVNEYTATTQGTDGYSFDDVEEGTYSIEISAPGSLGYTINNLVVEAGETAVPPSVSLLFGDCDQNGTIAGQDIAQLFTEYGQEVDAEDACDVDGNGTVTGQDLGIILLTSHYGMDVTTQVIDLAE